MRPHRHELRLHPGLARNSTAALRAHVGVLCGKAGCADRQSLRRRALPLEQRQFCLPFRRNAGEIARLEPRNCRRRKIGCRGADPRLGLSAVAGSNRSSARQKNRSILR